MIKKKLNRAGIFVGSMVGGFLPTLFGFRFLSNEWIIITTLVCIFSVAAFNQAR